MRISIISLLRPGYDSLINVLEGVANPAIGKGRLFSYASFSPKLSPSSLCFVAPQNLGGIPRDSEDGLNLQPNPRRKSRIFQRFVQAIRSNRSLMAQGFQLYLEYGANEVFGVLGLRNRVPALPS